MIGKRLKVARAATGVSLRALAELIGNRVSAQQIGKYERDEDLPNSIVLIALSEALSAPLDYLVGAISESRAAELLKITIHDLNQRMEAPTAFSVRS